MKELIELQKVLHVPKSKKQQNYMYRSTEDILEAAKLVMPEGCFIVMSDSVECIGNRNYITATAHFQNGEGKAIEATGLAWEPDKIAAMSSPQITGSCSSYARKSALCGLLSIDDNKDPDSLSKLESETTKAPEKATKAQLDILTSMAVEMETTNPKGFTFLNGVIKDPTLTNSEAEKLINKGNK